MIVPLSTFSKSPTVPLSAEIPVVAQTKGEEIEENEKITHKGTSAFEEPVSSQIVEEVTVVFDYDKCKICGGKSDVGVIAIKNGVFQHAHYCEKHYYSHVKTGDDSNNPVARKKAQPKQWTKAALELKKKGLRVQEKNGGLQLVVTLGRTVFDYWPSSEKYISRETNTRGQGKANFLADIGVE